MSDITRKKGTRQVRSPLVGGQNGLGGAMGAISQTQVFKLIAELTGSKNTVSVPMAFVVMLKGDVTAAYFLSQVLYWSDKTHDPDGWFYKSGDEWEAEIGLSWYKVTRVAQKLAVYGVETEKRMANGAPTVHYRLNRDTFISALTNSIFKKLENQETSKSDFEETQKSDFQEPSESITETTQRSLQKDIAEPPTAFGAGEQPIDTTPPTPTLTPYQVLFGELCQAFGYDHKTLSKEDKKELGSTCSYVYSQGAQPGDIDAEFRWLKKIHGPSLGFKNFTHHALRKYWKDFQVWQRGQQTPVIHKPKLTDEEKADIRDRMFAPVFPAGGDS